MTFANQIARNTLILLINNIATSMLALILTITITRGLGSVVFGQYAVVLAWVLPLTVLVDFGIGTLITRNVAQDRPAAADYLRSTHPLRWILGSTVIAAIWLSAGILSDDMQVVVALRVGILLAVIDTLFASYTAVFRAWEIMWPILILNVALLLMQLIGATLVIWLNGNVIHLVSAMVIADSLQLAATWLWWQRLARDHKTQSFHQPGSACQLVHSAWPFALAGILAILQVRLMIVLLDQYKDARQVGWYAAAGRLVESARLVPNALFSALFPQLAALAHESDHFERLFQRAGRLVAAYGLAFAIAMTLSADFLVKLLFGAEFSASAIALRLLAWALIPGLLRALFTLKLYAHQQERPVNYFMAGSLMIQMVAGMFLIPAYGLSGAAWTVIIGETSLLLSLMMVAHFSVRFVGKSSPC
jgi:O-antigen/teichoic acid export membrane protein